MTTLAAVKLFYEVGNMSTNNEFPIYL